MKALTLWQPWASLVALGEKQVETRIWSTKYRGELAIHASANLPPAWLGRSRFSCEFADEVADVLKVRRDRDDRLGVNVDSAVRNLPRGSVLCIARIVSIEPTERVRDLLSRRESIFGNYEDGRYAWFLHLVEKFEQPIPAKGNRLLWNWEGRTVCV